MRSPAFTPVINDIDHSDDSRLVLLRAAPAEERAREKSASEDRAKTFKQRVQQSTTQIAGRDFVLVTYHNIGMIDWATLFWGWLDRSGIKRFMLMELDGLTCEASRALNASISFECVNGYDLMLPPEYTNIKKASGLQDWGAHPPSRKCPADRSHPASLASSLSVFHLALPTAAHHPSTLTSQSSR